LARNWGVSGRFGWWEGLAWLRGECEAKEFERAGLQRGGGRELLEGAVGGGKADRVAGERAEVGEQVGEVVRGEPVRGGLRVGLVVSGG
jgi:hypothetical protein